MVAGGVVEGGRRRVEVVGVIVWSTRLVDVGGRGGGVLDDCWRSSDGSKRDVDGSSSAACPSSSLIGVAVNDVVDCLLDFFPLPPCFISFFFATSFSRVLASEISRASLSTRSTYSFCCPRLAFANATSCARASSKMYPMPRSISSCASSGMICMGRPRKTF